MPSSQSLAIAGDRSDWGRLIGAATAVAAAGLAPQLFDPNLPSVRSAILRAPELESFVLLQAVAQVGFLILGGYLADVWRSLRSVRIALAGLAGASVVGALGVTPTITLFTQVVGWACAGFIITFAIGSVAMLSRPELRATAIGIMYAVLGAATVTTQVLLGLLATTQARWVAFVPCTIVSVVAIALLPATLPSAAPIGRASRLSLGALCLFAFGVVAAGAAIIQFTPTVDPLRLFVLVGGVAAMVAAYGVHRAAVAAGGGTDFKIRTISVVLIIGIAVGFAQAAPLLQLPLYFEGVRGIAPIMNFVALAPLFAGLVLAGPATGWILTRWDGRLVIAGGALAIGLANLGLAATLGRTTWYVWLIVPMAMIGAGFVLATTVRTAILFVSVPRQMSASAVGLNEASVGLGNRIGVVVSTVVFAVVSIRAYAGTVAEAAAPDSQVESFRNFLGSIGLADLQSLTASLEPATLETYRQTAVTGLQASLVIAGVVAIAGCLLGLARLPAQGQLRAWGSADDPPRGTDHHHEGSSPAAAASSTRQPPDVAF